MELSNRRNILTDLPQDKSFVTNRILFLVVFRAGLHVLEKRRSFASVENRSPYRPVHSLVTMTQIPVEQDRPLVGH